VDEVDVLLDTSVMKVARALRMRVECILKLIEILMIFFLQDSIMVLKVLRKTWL